MAGRKTRNHAGSISSTGSLMQEVPETSPPAIEEEPTFQSLSQAIHARRAEFTKKEHVRIKIGTWNVASHKGTERDLAGWFVQGRGVQESLTGHSSSSEHGHDDRESVTAQEERYDQKQSSIPKHDQGEVPGNDDIGIYVLALQEVVDIGAVSEALRPYTDPSVAKKWKDVLESALPKGYMLIAEQQLIGLLLLVYASPEVSTEISGVSVTSVGTGLGGYMGNKGAVTARIVLGETTRLVFVNSHLAAGADKSALERRNWDASQVIARTRFAALQDTTMFTDSTGEHIGDEDFAFWAGDLNYRLEGIPGDDVRRLLMLHTRNEYDLSNAASKKIDHEIEVAAKSAKKRVDARASISSSISSHSAAGSSTRSSMESEHTQPTLGEELDASEDPASLQTTISSLLPHDELHQQMKARKAFHDGWKEGQIDFLPTYKYDVGSVGVFDSSDKKRGPSFCDRILYRTRRDKLAYDALVKEENNAKKRDAEMKANGADQAGTDEEILYDYDPDNDGVNDDYGEYNDEDEERETIITKEGFEDEISLEHYITHQRVLSSDHKPMDAVFLLKYDRIVPEQRAKIHAEMVKNLDRAENETRPTITVVVDKHHPGDHAMTDQDPAKFQGVDFGEVRWGQAKHRNVTIANTGRVTASFEFIDRPIGPGQDAGLAPSWLNMKLDDAWIESAGKNSKVVTLEPGDAVSIALEVRVFDMRMVKALNENDRQLDDILLLRVENGRDHFIPLRADWQDTSLGRGIEKLIRIPEGGIRKLQRQKPHGKHVDDVGKNLAKLSMDEPIRFSAPRELFRLTEAIENLTTQVLAEWEMDHSADLPTPPWERYHGWPLEREAWSERRTEAWRIALSDACDALDSDKPLDSSFTEALPKMQRLYVLCDLLLTFLQHLPDGVVTEDLWSQINKLLVENEKSKRKMSEDEERMAIQEVLATSPPHSICFILLTTMLDRILRELRMAQKVKDSERVGGSDEPNTGTVRRLTGLAKKAASKHDSVDAAAPQLAQILADAVVRLPADVKTRSTQDKRKAELVLLFLSKEST
ncbi:hypothetical protein MRB53_040800 [Persea americana]|nr:hypothetical protein MRB53_040800 [Persea americana]